MMRPFETALSVVVSLALAAAVLLFAGCSWTAEDAEGVLGGQCAEGTYRTLRKGKPVQCKVLICRMPARGTTLFCDEVP